MSTRHYINDIVKNGEIINTKTKSVLIVGHENIQLNNYLNIYLTKKKMMLNNF